MVNGKIRNCVGNYKMFGSRASPIILHFAFCILHLKKPSPRNTGQRLLCYHPYYKRTVIRRPCNGGHRRSLLEFSPLLGSDVQHLHVISGLHHPRLALNLLQSYCLRQCISYGCYNNTKNQILQVFYNFCIYIYTNSLVF